MNRPPAIASLETQVWVTCSLLALAAPGFAATSVQFSRDLFLADEFRSPAQVTVQRAGAISGSLTVTVIATNGAAAPGADFVPVATAITFAPGQTNKVVEIPVLDDFFAEPDKAVTLQLTGLPAGVTSTRAQASLLIRDDERPGSIDWGWSTTLGLHPQQVSNAFVTVVTWLPDGKAVLNVNVAGDEPFGRIVRINADGSVDSSFQISDNPAPYPQQVQATPDGKFLVSTSSVNQTALKCRLNADGTTDTGFSAAVAAVFPSGFNLAQAPGGKVLVWSLDSFFTVYLNGQAMPRLFRLNNDGSLDPTFTLNAPGWRFPELILPQPNGQILLTVLESAFPRVSKLFRLNQNGSVDNGFQVGRGEQMGSVLTQPDGKCVVSGHFPTFNGQTVNSIVRLNPDGSIDPSFQSGSGFLNSGPDRVWTKIHPLPAGQILVHGVFDSYKGAPARRGAVLNADGTLDAGAVSDQGTFVTFDGIDEVIEVPALFVRGQFVGIPQIPPDYPWNFEDGPILHFGYGPNRLRTELPLRIVSTRRDGDGTTRLTANALSGRSYMLQTSENLVDWSDLATHLATTNRIEFTDPPTNSPAQRFYRVKEEGRQ